MLKPKLTLIFILGNLIFFQKKAILQIDSLEVINNIKENIKNKAQDSIMLINGALNINSQYNFINSNTGSNNFDYRINANVNIKYKGLNVPFQYNFSNGRTISAFQGPNIRTPSFKNFGMSPSKNNTTIHIGNRKMDFSKYSYSNVRFKGFGFEHTPEKFQIKFFKGELEYINPEDLRYFSNVDPPFKRKAWGLNSAFKSEKIGFGFNIFKSFDVDHLTVTQNTKKENVVLEVFGNYNIVQNLDFIFSRSLSALTYDTALERTIIGNHNTYYNMLGLFEKNSSSIYAYTNYGSIKYSEENYSLGINFESIDPKYKSLGSNLFDNNYTSITVDGSFISEKKIQGYANLGIRKTKQEVNNEPQLYNLVFASTLRYQLNDNNGINLSFSNLRNTNRSYFINNQTFEVDSISLSQTNLSTKISSTHRFGPESKYTLTNFVTRQSGKGIESDSINIENKVLNLTIGSTLSLQLSKHKIIANLIYLNSQQTRLTTNIYTIDISDKIDYSKKGSIKVSSRFNYYLSENDKRPQQVFRFTHLFKFKESIEISNMLELRASDKNEQFGITDFFLGGEISYKLNHKQIVNLDLLK